MIQGEAFLECSDDSLHSRKASLYLLRLCYEGADLFAFWL